MTGASSSARRLVVVSAAGALAGVCVALDLAAVRANGKLALGTIVDRVAIAAVLGALALLLLRAAVLKVVSRFAPAARAAGSSYSRFEELTYAAFLLPALGMIGVHVSVPLVYAALILFAGSQLGLVLRSEARARTSAGFFESDGYLALLFLFSGMAALIYEIVWQRVLHATYGVNIESVTLIVAVFMLGLGLGALGGGYLSTRFPGRLPELFAAAELLIGAFGAVSIPLIEAVGNQTLELSMLGVALVVFALLVLPAALMGATLPILVAHVTRRDPNVGASMGRLYALNTLGAALASLLTVDVLFVLLGRQATVLVAVLLNGFVGVSVYRFAVRVGKVSSESTPQVTRSFPALWVLGAAAVVGFISLSQEILWVRVIGFAMRSVPHVFGHLLGSFLIGLAIGAHDARGMCRRADSDVFGMISRRLLVAAVACWIAVPAVARLLTVSTELGILAAYLAVCGGAYLLGAVLPVLAHVGTESGASAGVSVAWIYAFNIVGCTAGPLVTGFVLLDRFTLEECVLLLTLLTTASSAALALGARSEPRARRALFGSLLVASLFVLGLHGFAYRQLFERLLWGTEYHASPTFKHLLQNRSGVLAVAADPAGDLMYGTGAYDGTFNIDGVTNSNGIDRAYMIASLHREPRRALVIGLSTGSWVRVLSAHQAVESITVVEINPGYERLIRRYPGHREILEDPRIVFSYEDGRRWLRRHSSERFDFILMNTTWHFRANITNLLSLEFLELCRSRLEPGGVIYYNTTSSPDAVLTAASAFPHVIKYMNFVAASDRPIALTEQERRENLARFVLAGRRMLQSELIERFAKHPLPEIGSEYRAREDLRVITDDNMLSEFKSVHATNTIVPKFYRFYDARSAWGEALGL